ncbi:putative integral membrane protein [Caulobacter sp. AP07]|jgi:Ni/Co efflux regulator RcnB|uniref:RcnB family protein n=1 Tax=Caulobacter sp. AP07 TaxID=1144304 RepID=UPI00027210F8|nr:RcnB family protein [Caulobacter sp. AP07]EJL34798.1 putative integral membrane protein [Caulobacter sp. AP07]
MKRLIITTLAATLLAGTALSGTAMAAGQRYDDRRDDRYEQRHDQRDYRHDRRDYRHDRKDERKAYRHWQRGQRLDARYRDNRYYVRDYHRYGLRAPPRGYRWQRVDDSYILAAVATGVIMSVIIANN